MRLMACLSAHAQRRYPMKKWREALLTDESRFTLFRRGDRHHLHVHHAECFTDACVVERDTFGAVLLWTGETFLIL